MTTELVKLQVSVRPLQLDEATVVSIFQNIRERYPVVLLLEGAEYIADNNSFSYIGADPIAEIKIVNNQIQTRVGQNFQSHEIGVQTGEVLESLKVFKSQFIPAGDSLPSGCINGLFGYLSYDCVRYFESVELKVDYDHEVYIPEATYYLFRWILCIDHYHHRVYLVHNRLESDEAPTAQEIIEFQQLIQSSSKKTGSSFEVLQAESSEMSEDQHLALIENCKKHIFRGDVFQIVASRRFSVDYRGDDFEVYRALRSVNPSPYMFYLDTGNFRIFGSSPEAELIVQKTKAELHPIAGTVLRSGDPSEDAARTQKLLADPKENSEHVMLVDLARNDLSRHCHSVQVETFREVQTYSHVIHLVSKVSGTLSSAVDCLDLLADTFPAGTLSGAPKFKAMTLLNQYEPSQRGCYGGAVGFLGFDNSCKHAIIIRSFLSKGRKLFYQAGAGIVADSNPDSEVQEVRNKLMALGRAIHVAANK